MSYSLLEINNKHKLKQYKLKQMRNYRNNDKKVSSNNN